jgi:hypothetical protein
LSAWAITGLSVVVVCLNVGKWTLANTINIYFLWWAVTLGSVCWAHSLFTWAFTL